MSEAHVESQAPAAEGHHGTTPAESDNTNVLAIAFWFIAIVVFIIGAVTFAHQYFGIQIRKEISEKVLSATNPMLRDLHATEKAKLSKYQWVDKNAGVVRIPVERAQELVLRDWGSRAQAAAAAEGAGAVPSDENAASPSQESDPKDAKGSEGVK